MSQSLSRAATEPFVPRRGLRGGHVQTLAGNFLPRYNNLPAPEERLFQVEPEVQVLCHCHWQANRADALTLIIVHGLEGSSNSQYVIGTGNKAWAKGWNVVRLNIRNCGGTEKLGPTLYHSGLSDDIGSVAETLVRDEHLRAFALAGFSMGGNQVLKCVGEWGSDAPRELVAAAGISPACDLSISADELHKPHNRIYEWKFLQGLRRRIRRKAELFPDRYDVRHLKNVHSIRDFDHEITARYMGFESAEDYYTRASSARVVQNIAVPTLVVHSADDPFIIMLPETEFKFIANPCITYLRTEHGGHCAFLSDPNGYDGRWAERQIINFVERNLSY
ncbi:MAG TPA: alpha/beta fold hydrolase [Clostridia bacterium]|nr:alpha/beta fold hydrolase [Clostridia bacterium]